MEGPAAKRLKEWRELIHVKRSLKLMSRDLWQGGYKNGKEVRKIENLATKSIR